MTERRQPQADSAKQPAPIDATIDVLVASLKAMMARGAVEQPSQPPDAADRDASGGKPELGSS